MVTEAEHYIYGYSDKKSFFDFDSNISLPCHVIFYILAANACILSNTGCEYVQLVFNYI